MTFWLFGRPLSFDRELCMPHPPLRLGVNVDHVATLRNARGGARPDPVRAALVAIEAGADGITAHLREDRRHIRDDDMARLKAEISKPLNFEMAATKDMLKIALATRPHAVCLVPERREELTTEGGLDVVGQHNALAPFIARLSDSGVRVSLFIAADPAQIEMAARLRAPVVEIHTGAWCDAVVDGFPAKAEAEWKRIVAGAALARSAGLEVHAGHGLDYATAEKIASLGEIVELNIGYFMMGEALFAGLAGTVRAMRTAMERGRSKVPHDYRHRFRSDRHSPGRQGHRASWRSLSRPDFYRRRACPGRPPRQEPEHGRGNLCQALRGQGGLFKGARHRYPAWGLVA